MEEKSSPIPAAPSSDDCHHSPTSSTVKVETSPNQVDGSTQEPLTPQGHSEDMADVLCPQPPLQQEAAVLDAGVVCGLLTSLKQEATEADEEEEMALPDSTPGSEDSLDSYSQRHSPSPMASLRLTRADTTTITTTTSSHAGPRLDDGEGIPDAKQFDASGRVCRVSWLVLICPIWCYHLSVTVCACVCVCVCVCVLCVRCVQP